ncbi:SDR family oxidoreductase [Pseudomonas sp. NW5]|uniref:SDR family oxidoreductase n=1 Tax=Pseudomonas sp. NW5 TaxID=2934934 RepID=UPI00201FE77C|nr:SDR family oxidoreductase [Pseudomonas sp. NW5]MCL7461567.1 SDR family oxidoreductase [Pseudomonas sp. NW5]
MNLADCRILLTGASGGIGEQLALQLAAAGAQLLLVARQRERLEPLVARYPERIEAVCADLTQYAGREAVVEAVRRRGGINLLINAAGVNRFGLFEQQSDETIAALLQLNVTATLQLTQALLPLLHQEEQAMVVNVGSTLGSIGYPGYAAYCASKFAVRGFSEALRRELADTPIKVLYVAPRATHTAMNDASVVAMNAELNSAMDTPAAVAAQVLEAIAHERKERYLGWPEKLFVRLNALLPRLVDRALRKQLPIIQRFARGQS